MSKTNFSNHEMPVEGGPPHDQAAPGCASAEQSVDPQQTELLKDGSHANELKSVSTTQGRGREATAVYTRGGPPILKLIRKETGMGRQVLDRVQKLHPGNPLRQVDEFFADFFIPAATGRKRTVGIKTEQLYGVQMRVMVKQLRGLNMPIQNLSEFSTRHVAALTRHYEAQGLSASSLQKKNTVLRRFGTWIGKPDMTPRLCDLVSDPTRSKRSYSAVESKAWSANGVDPDEIFKRMDLECSVAGLQLRLQLAFGLRPREAVMLKPIAADQGKNLFVTDGTKGGRARMVPIDTDEKRALLEQAKTIARGNSRGILSNKPSMSLNRAIARFYYLTRKVGICKNGLGVTLHGLRHEFAGSVYKEATGVEAPVNGGRLDDLDLARRAMQITSEQLGHSRKHAGAAYLGSKRHLDYTQRKNLNWLTGRLENNTAVLGAVKACGPCSWWVVGSAAAGKPIRGSWILAYRAESKPAVNQTDSDLGIAAMAMAVADAASQAVGYPACLLREALLPNGAQEQGERLELVGLWRASVGG